MLRQSLQIIQWLFTKETSSSPAGESPLTNMSMKIGQALCRHMERDPVHWRDELKLGDLIIEAFYNCGFVDIEYPQLRDSSHIVIASSRYPELARIPKGNSLQDTTFHRISDIISSTQRKNRPIIKGKPDYPVDINTPFIRAINKLQQTPWRVNERVFKALKREKGFTSTSKEKMKEKELKRRSKLLEWDFIKRKATEVVEDGRDFYQYISVDYRGRLYYDEPFFNFQSSDLAKGILQFSEPKLLTDEGNRWLAIHTAASYNQSYGIDEIPEWVSQDYRAYLKSEGLESIAVDKMTLDDRVEWTQQNLDWILEKGSKLEFAENAEKKVMFLAACVEWHDYVTTEGDYYSCLPLPIDGSNNGWQHLGAISKDEETGELVGLVPVDIQKDFYVQTAKELINQTSDNRLMEILSSMPMKSIRKGISKRGSMTRAYSAGAGKIAENMYFDCRVEDYHDTYGIDKNDCKKFARILIQAINTVCPGPLATMGYLQGLAAFEIGKTGIDPALIERRRELVRTKEPTDEELDELDDLTKTISEQGKVTTYGNGMKQICWTTPSGFQVTYEDWQMLNSRQQVTITGYRRVNHVVKHASDKPDIKKFMCGISPNFIHSMDASHMSLVIDEWDGVFGAVHDSFATHASDVDSLLALTKDKFIDMYDVDNFYNYIEDQIITNKTDLDVDQPDRGSLQIREIEDSDYFFA